MKNILSTFIVVAACCATAFSQAPSKSIEIGAGIGFSSANASSGSITNDAYRSGFNVALSAENYFSDRWGLKVKVIYDQKGWNGGYLTDASYHTTYTNYELNYITVPVMADWHFGRTRNWYLNFGPYIGFLANAKASSLNMDVKDYFKSTDIGIALGIGIKFKIAEKTKLFIEFDGQGGASDIIKDNTGSSINVQRSSFNIGLNF